MITASEILKGKRKLFLILSVVGISLAIATAMVFAGKMTVGEWVDLTKWIGAGGMATFGIGNGVEHLAKGRT